MPWDRFTSRLLARLRPPTTPRTSERALRRWLDRAAGDRHDLPAETFLAAAINFYRDVPVAGIVREEGADMLLFQYGTYDWGEGAAFEVEVTRQFAHDSEGTLSHLHATLRFAPDPALEALGAFDVWCERRADVDTFARRVLDSPAVAAVKGRPELQRVVRWEMV